MEPEERAAAGLFLAFQYPVEIPGVGNMTFLRTAMNAQRKSRGEEELSAADFLKHVREKAKTLNIHADMLKRPVNVGFSGGEKKRNEILQMAMLEPKMCVLDETDSGLDVDAMKLVAEGMNALRDDKPLFPDNHPLSASAGSHQTRCRSHHGKWTDRQIRRARAGTGSRTERLRRSVDRGCVMTSESLRRQSAEDLLGRYMRPESGAWHSSAVSAAEARMAAMGAPVKRDEYWKYTDPAVLTSAARRLRTQRLIAGFGLITKTRSSFISWTVFWIWCVRPI